MIGTRLTHSQMSDVVGGRIGRLNQSMASTLRKAAMDNGIKQTEQGLRLEFYTVEEEELDNLKNEQNDAYLAMTKGLTVRPLVQFNKQKFSDKVDEINSKPEYRGGMKRDVYAKYERELRTAMAELCEVIGTDTNKRKKAETFTHDYKVGDWIRIYGDYGWLKGNARITRVTKSSYWYEMAEIRGGRWANFNSAKAIFKDVTGWVEPHCGQEWEFTIPYAGNEHEFTFEKVKIARATKHNPSKVEPGYYSERRER